MVEVEADKAKNLLTITFSGDLVPEEAKRYQEKVKASWPNCKTGFRLLTDLRRLATMDRACLPDVKNNDGFVQPERDLESRQNHSGFPRRTSASISCRCSTIATAFPSSHAKPRPKR
jgi:hypothetical protein